MDFFDSNTDEEVVIVDPATLQPETLSNLAREFILRESHDDAIPSDLDTLVQNVITRIKKRECLITFDVTSESVGVILARDFRARNSP